MNKKQVCSTVCGEYMGDEVCQVALKECGDSLTDVKTELFNTNKSLEDCQNERESQYKDLLNCQKQQQDAISALQKAQIELQGYKDVNAERDRLNLEYPKTELIYRGKRFVEDIYHQRQMVTFDVREFIYANDYHLKKVASEITAIYNPQNEEQFVRAVNSWVANNNVKYETDSYQFAWEDYWQFPEETIVLGKGDCEDTSILVASLLLSFNIPSYKVRVNLGLVYGQYGHAYLQYWNGTEWLLVETTMPWKYTQPLEPMSQHTEYKTYWAFNDQLAWCIDDGMTFGTALEKLTSPESRAWQRTRQEIGLNRSKVKSKSPR